jgi:hypothetical protein
VPASQTTRDGYDLGWNQAMTALLGEVTTVIAIDERFIDTVHIAADNGGWYWLMEWLTPVEEA